MLKAIWHIQTPELTPVSVNTVKRLFQILVFKRNLTMLQFLGVAYRYSSWYYLVFVGKKKKLNPSILLHQKQPNFCVFISR